MNGCSKFRMWGVIPVQFDDFGSWKVSVDCPVCRTVLTGVATGLLKVNSFVERMSNHNIVLQVPMTPVVDKPTTLKA